MTGALRRVARPRRVSSLPLSFFRPPKAANGDVGRAFAVLPQHPGALREGRGGLGRERVPCPQPQGLCVLPPPPPGGGDIDTGRSHPPLPLPFTLLSPLDTATLLRSGQIVSPRSRPSPEFFAACIPPFFEITDLSSRAAAELFILSSTRFGYCHPSLIRSTRHQCHKYRACRLEIFYVFMYILENGRFERTDPPLGTR